MVVLFTPIFWGLVMPVCYLLVLWGVSIMVGCCIALGYLGCMSLAILCAPAFWWLIGFLIFWIVMMFILLSFELFFWLLIVISMLLVVSSLLIVVFISLVSITWLLVINVVGGILIFALLLTLFCWITPFSLFYRSCLDILIGGLGVGFLAHWWDSGGFFCFILDEDDRDEGWFGWL